VTAMLFLDLRKLTQNGSDCRKRSVVVKQSRIICLASFFEVIIDKIYEAGIDEMRLFTKNVISYFMLIGV
jgi:hypothetical protein